MSRDQQEQFAGLLAEYREVAYSYTSSESFAEEEMERLIGIFAKADAEERSALIGELRATIDHFKTELEIEAETGKTALEILFDVLDNPSNYTSEHVAIAEKRIEELIAITERKLREAPPEETDSIRELSSFLQALRRKLK